MKVGCETQHAYVPPVVECYSVLKGKGIPTPAIISMKLEDILSQPRHTRTNILYDSTYISYLE